MAYFKDQQIKSLKRCDFPIIAAVLTLLKWEYARCGFGDIPICVLLKNPKFKIQKVGIR